jgi:superfamily II DNA/RNA helicase
VILSDDRGASKKIHAFSQSVNPEDRWLVAVRMVSEGVDVPRLAVGVWATNYRTDLFFAQAVGRFVRAKSKGEVATIFLPAVRPLLALAANLEEQRKHVIAPAEQSEDEDEHELIDPIMDEEESEKEDNPHEFTALSADANFAHILFNGKAYDGSLSEEELDYLGIPGLLSPTEMAQLLQQRDKDIKKLISATTPNPNAPVSNPITDAKEIKELKKEINRMVSRIALSKGIPHAQVHARAKKAIAGPPTANAPAEVLKSRIEWLEQM